MFWQKAGCSFSGGLLYDVSDPRKSTKWDIRYARSAVKREKVSIYIEWVMVPL